MTDAQRSRRFGTLLAAAAVAVALLPGCGGEPDTSGRRPIGREAPDVGRQAPGDARRDLPSRLAAHLDSANAAYRAGDYREALRLYRAATRADPRAATAWYGVYMAHAALGNRRAADSAMQRIESITGSRPGRHPAVAGDTAGS